LQALNQESEQNDPLHEAKVYKNPLINAPFSRALYSPYKKQLENRELPTSPTTSNLFPKSDPLDESKLHQAKNESFETTDNKSKSSCDAYSQRMVQQRMAPLSDQLTSPRFNTEPSFGGLFVGSSDNNQRMSEIDSQFEDSFADSDIVKNLK